MSLKVQINGTKKSLTGPGRAPVTFINGVKKRLTKGVTFINGKKEVLWDAHDLQIDYISGVYQAFGSASVVHPVMATNNKMVLSAENGYVGRFDISNVSNPILEGSVEMGRVCGYSLPDSTDSKQVFFAYSSNLKIGQCVNIDPNTVEITASNTISLPIPTPGGILGTNTWLGYNTGTYTVDFYVNGVSPIAYSYTYREKTPGTVVSGGASYQFMIAKKSQTEFIGTQPSLAIPSGIAAYTATGLQQHVSGAGFGSIMMDDDGTIVAAGYSGFAIYTDTYQQKARVECTSSGRVCVLIGRIRDYYYVAEGPQSSGTADQKIILRVFTRDGVQFETRDLNISMNWVNQSGVPQGFQQTAYVMPHVSKTGALVFTFAGSPYTLDVSTMKAIRILGY